MTVDHRVLLAPPMIAGGTAASPAAPPWRRLRLGRRHFWLIPGLAIAVYANAYSSRFGIGLVPLLAFGIIPHMPALLGVGQPHGRGQMAARAVPLFNVMHHPVLPLVVIGFAAAGVLSPFWFVGGLAWFSHIVVDLAFGHGLRTHDGWRRDWWSR